MKVVQINCVYNNGSTGKITADLHHGLLAKGIESVVCYGRGVSTNENNVYKVCPEWYSKLNNAVSRITGIMYGGCYYSTNKLINIIKKEKPDIVHLQCINGYFINIYRLVKWLKDSRIKTVLTLHAEFMFTGGCGHAFDCNEWMSEKGCSSKNRCFQFHKETKSLLLDRTNKMWRLMKDAFDGFDDNLLVTSVSPWLMERAKLSPILKNKKHFVVLNGLDTSVFKCYDTVALREELGIKNKKVIIHVTPFYDLDPNHIKGGYYVNEIAKLLREENVKVLVVGPYKEGLNVADNVILMGRVTDKKDLAMLYSLADVTLLTSKKETFSMVTAESLCCGTPVVGFKAGGPEQIALGNYSRFSDYGNLDSMVCNISYFLNKQDTKIDSSDIYKYSVDSMVTNYIKCYDKLLSRGENR